MVPVGLAGLATSTPASGFLRVRREQHVAGDRPARLRRGLDQHRLAAERREDVAVRRIARRRDGDAVAGLEHRQERQDETRRRSGGDDTRSGANHRHRRSRVVPRDARAQRPDAERLGIAERPDSAARAAASAVVGAGAAGWPTSMWMTRPPAASIRAAAAITSITMNGGTSLRAEGVISRRAASSIIHASCGRGTAAPLSPHFCGHLVGVHATTDRERKAR